MKDFFLNTNNTNVIKLFSTFHISLIIVTAVIIGLVILNKNKFQDLSTKHKKLIRYIFGSILILNIILRRGSFIYYGVYDYRIHLDIGFCNFTTILFIIYSFTGNKKLFNICWHMAFIGPLLAILLPSYNLLPNTYSFYSFILMHHVIFIFTFIYKYLDDFQYQKNSILKAIEFIVIYLVIIFLFDYCFHVTYNFPLTFVNNSIINIPFINKLANNSIIPFIIYIIIIIVLVLLGNVVLKSISKSKKGS